jgi:hypothetical protein
MSESILDSEANNVCEALNCFARATNKISMKMGNKGIILLELCNDCVPRFVGDKVSLIKT